MQIWLAHQDSQFWFCSLVAVESETPHRCNLLCLGPLTFHSHAVGDKVRLSQGCRLAVRREGTFRNGVVFSSRPVTIHERIRLRVEKAMFSWHGALRVGFTNVPPTARSLPLPCLAIPNLTNNPGHWAAAVPESYCRTGSKLEFWVSSGGSIYVQSNNCPKHKLLTGVDLSQPLWAMIDIYGQTCSIFLLGSEKKGLVSTRRSCPAPEHLTSPDINNLNNLISDLSNICLDKNISADEYCVVCMERKAGITLPCGHRCLCDHCSPRVLQEIGTCPLCRHEIRAPSVEGR
ncbi:E3 ubiquitin-protein ligase NEURL3-like isoform X1 [Seriola lalandi dorsalis]|uniref:E3 ubiquitin-protein ligase NEURL3-like n=1 Tax=Seriola lalandi dorsalis TaxID=1841481 RepID=A0A3B4XIQ2_SERLL|nr:E3 ubiquitin-protein ligase NEURL3-like isoform X1 [Seriola lalandi dorsalis]